MASPRKLKRISLTLPEEQILMIDECSKALGLDRGSFLQIFFDAYAENMVSFATGWLKATEYFREKLEEMGRVEEAKKIAEALGTKLTERRIKSGES